MSERVFSANGCWQSDLQSLSVITNEFTFADIPGEPSDLSSLRRMTPIFSRVTPQQLIFDGTFPQKGFENLHPVPNGIGQTL